MKTKKKQKTPAGTKVSKQFDFKLNREEMAQFGENAAALDGEIDEMNTQFDEVKNNWKAKINTREAKRAEMLATIRAKKQTRTVDATLVKDFDAREIQYWFEGEIIERRTMTEAECQMEIEPKTRKKAKEQKIDPGTTKEQIERQHTADVIKAETRRSTKLSAVDGPTAS